jgi:transposase
MLHHMRHLFVRQQTSVINAIRAHLSEFGITAGGLHRCAMTLQICKPSALVGQNELIA